MPASRRRPCRGLGVALAAAWLAAGAWSAPARAAVKVGDVAPDYLGQDFRNQPVRASQYRGKVLIVSFWASWCGPCLKEIPVLESLQAVAGRDALGVVAVNFNEDESLWNALRAKLADLEMRMARDPDKEVPGRYGVDSLPRLFMIDRAGRVARIHAGYSEKNLDAILAEVNRLLATPPTVPAPASAAGPVPNSPGL